MMKNWTRCVSSQQLLFSCPFIQHAPLRFAPVCVKASVLGTVGGCSVIRETRALLY